MLIKKLDRNYFSVWIMITVIVLTDLHCKKTLGLNDASPDPVSVFEETWKVMDERYALFDIKGVDWHAIHDQYRSNVTTTTPENDLFRLTNNMLQTLQDGHVALVSNLDTGVYDNFYKAFPHNFNYSIVVENYLQNQYSRTGPVIYKVVDSVGYFYYDSFENDITDAEVTDLFNAMKATKGLIIDVRDNPGGNSVNVDKIASRFLSEKKLVKYEKIKHGSGHDDFTIPPQPYYLSAANEIYDRPVVLLTNRRCYSACNDFALYLSELQNVMVMGDQTGGGGGIPHNYILANGWKLQYTATVTLSPEGQSIENGIQPDQKIDITSQDEFYGRDPILEAAFQILK